jgi:hypothetical protein
VGKLARDDANYFICYLNNSYLCSISLGDRAFFRKNTFLHHSKNAFMTSAVVFKALVFRSVLKIIGLRQQLTDWGSPWQNGRIERF